MASRKGRMLVKLFLRLPRLRAFARLSAAVCLRSCFCVLGAGPGTFVRLGLVLSRVQLLHEGFVLPWHF